MMTTSIKEAGKKPVAKRSTGEKSAKKKQGSLVQEWDLIPIAAIGVVAWALSWVLWNWREAELDFSRFITPVEPFGLLAQSFPIVGTARFTDILFIILAWCTVSILWLSPWKSKQQSNVLRVFTHLAGAMIAFRLFWDFWHWLHLNSQWYHETIFFTGKVAITFIFLSLACTPLVTLFGWSALNALKKPLGNWGFGFALLHLLLFTLDNGFIEERFAIGAVIAEAFQKRYALVGSTAFLLLLPLFLTSNKWSQKKLGKNWKKLHQLAYVIGVLAAAHYIWVWWSKKALVQPIAYAAVLILLLVLRIPAVKNRIRDFKKQLKTNRKAAAVAT